jgi:hypothetical protein
MSFAMMIGTESVLDDKVSIFLWESTIYAAMVHGDDGGRR